MWSYCEILTNINQLMSIFQFFLHVSGKSYHFLRFNYLEICFSPCILNIYLKSRYITAQEVQFLEFHTPRFCDRHIFLTDTSWSLPSFYCFAMEFSSSWCWISLFNQLTLLLLCLNIVTSTEVNATKNVIILDAINKHI